MDKHVPQFRSEGRIHFPEAIRQAAFGRHGTEREVGNGSEGPSLGGELMGL